MLILKPIVFGALVLAALSVTQMDAFARGHEGPRPHFEHQEVPHNAINNPGAHPSGTTSGTTTSQTSRHRGPEVVTPGGISQEVVIPEGGATGALPGQKDLPKAMVSCTKEPGDPTCVK